MGHPIDQSRVAGPFWRASAPLLAPVLASLQATLLALTSGLACAQDVDYRELAASAVKDVDAAIAQGAWKPDLADLDRHQAAPEWFLDAKLGIYFHWGVYSVPAFDNEWYPRNMHVPGSAANVHHVQTHGDPSRFGYHQFVEGFTAQRFDAQAWAQLFKRAGAKFAGPVFEHHDGYSMWGSRLTPWNSVQTGPRRDIGAEVAKAVRAQGMKFIATFHHGFNGQFTERQSEATGFYPRHDGWPTTSEDPRLRLLYGNLDQQWSRNLWLGKLAEVIDGYQPDLIWFDFCLRRLPPDVQNRFLAYYFDRAQEWGKQVVVTCKNHDVPVGIAVEDFEKGRAERLTRDPWLTDDTISLGSWCYTDDLKIKPASEIIQVLADIVSKNGILLLNISPRADGVIPDDQQNVLREIGAWLHSSGESIYETRPWETSGEGPTKISKGGHFVDRVQYTPRDIRYTRSKDGKWLYAIVLGMPPGPSIVLHSVKAAHGATGPALLLGSGSELRWEVDADSHVVLQWPTNHDGVGLYPYANALRLPAQGLTLHDEALADRYPELTLDASNAVIDGEQARKETIDGVESIGFWDRGDESVHWLVRIAEPGLYRVTGQVATQSRERIVIEADGSQAATLLPSTGSWREFQTVECGTLQFKRAGVHHVTMRPQDPASWHAVNLRRLVLVPR